jgi:hypothetical protein
MAGRAGMKIEDASVFALSQLPLGSWDSLSNGSHSLTAIMVDLSLEMSDPAVFPNNSIAFLVVEKKRLVVFASRETVAANLFSISRLTLVLT